METFAPTHRLDDAYGAPRPTPAINASAGACAHCRHAERCPGPRLPHDARLPPELRAAGQELRGPGEGREDVLVIHTGVATVSAAAPEGQRRIVNLLGPGEMSELATLRGRRGETVVRAWTDVLVCRLRAATLKDRLAVDVDLAGDIFQASQEQLQRSYHWVIEFTSGDLRQRLLRLLLALTEVFDGERIPLPSREDLGAMLGVTLESASRAVSQLRRVGVLRSCGGRSDYLVRKGLAMRMLGRSEPSTVSESEAEAGFTPPLAHPHATPSARRLGAGSLSIWKGASSC